MTHFPRHLRRSRQVRPRGFTLVELLLAVSITGLVAAAALTLATSASAGWANGSDNQRRGATAAAARARIERTIGRSIAALQVRPDDAGGAGVLLWRHDDFAYAGPDAPAVSAGDGRPQLGELALFRRSAATGRIELVELRPATNLDASARADAATTLTAAELSRDEVWDLLAASGGGPLFRGRPLLPGGGRPQDTALDLAVWPAPDAGGRARLGYAVRLADGVKAPLTGLVLLPKAPAPEADVPDAGPPADFGQQAAAFFAQGGNNNQNHQSNWGDQDDQGKDDKNKGGGGHGEYYWEWDH